MDQQQEGRLRNLAFSRERCEELRACGLMLDGDNETLVNDAVEFMLLARQALRGGRLNVRGSRNWEDV